MKRISEETVERRKRPVRVLQFGEGNFLRAFADWMIDVANEKGVMDAAVAVVKPRAGRSEVIDVLRRQDCMYHVVLEGMENGRAVTRRRLVTAVQDAFTPDDAERMRHYAQSPELQIVISNTTEAGIVYEADDVRADVPATFPGKVTGLLLQRFEHFGGDRTKGLCFVCCELIEDNGSRLKEYVLRHAREAGLSDGFAAWVDEACVFADTLVDRIVSGRPDDPEAEKAAAGYDDDAIVKGELYHQWVIGGEGAGRVRELMPLDRAGLNVRFAASVKDYRDKKVRILNGAHTAMTAPALQMGCETVGDAFANEDVSAFIGRMTEREVLAATDGDADELRSFAAATLERFRNPFIRHRLKSIALNSLSKWEARNLDTARDYRRKFGRTAECEAFGLAALLTMYAPGAEYTPDDTPEAKTYIAEHWDDADMQRTVSDILGSGRVFRRDVEAEAPGLASRTAVYATDIRKNGMAAALRDFLKSYK